jgi:hypothetical protein
MARLLNSPFFSVGFVRRAPPTFRGYHVGWPEWIRATMTACSVAEMNVTG